MINFLVGFTAVVILFSILTLIGYLGNIIFDDPFDLNENIAERIIASTLYILAIGISAMFFILIYLIGSWIGKTLINNIF